MSWLEQIAQLFAENSRRVWDLNKLPEYYQFVAPFMLVLSPELTQLV